MFEHEESLSAPVFGYLNLEQQDRERAEYRRSALYRTTRSVLRCVRNSDAAIVRASGPRHRQRVSKWIHVCYLDDPETCAERELRADFFIPVESGSLDVCTSCPLAIARVCVID
jgi:hypothetical protein